jgi:hypothetical protein
MPRPIGRFWRKAAGHGHVRSRRQNGHATAVGSGLSLTLNERRSASGEFKKKNS